MTVSKKQEEKLTLTHADIAPYIGVTPANPTAPEAEALLARAQGILSQLKSELERHGGEHTLAAVACYEEFRTLLSPVQSIQDVTVKERLDTCVRKMCEAFNSNAGQPT